MRQNNLFFIPVVVVFFILTALLIVWGCVSTCKSKIVINKTPVFRLFRDLNAPTTVIAGCTRNCRPYLGRVFKNIARIQEVLPVSQIVVAYDTSTDNTLRKLNQLKSSKRYPLKLLVNKEPLSKNRIENLTHARNRLLQQIHSLPVQPKYVIIMDMDDVCSQPLDVQVLQNTLTDSDQWDGVSFYNENYYDLFALSIGPFQTYNPNTTPHAHLQKIHDYLKKKMETSVNNYVTVDSAFNGFAVYKWDMFKKGMYKNVNDECEHKYFHKVAQLHGARIVISKKHLFPRYTGNHVNFLK
jgi:hypothetical protein